MSSKITPIAGKKLGKILRMLTSPRDGEAMAAVHELKRTLASERLDIHAIADVIEAPANGKVFTKADAKEIYLRGVEDGRREAEQQQGPISFANTEPTWHDIACACRDRKAWKDAREEEFVLHMVDLSVHGGELGEKQANWLRKIYARRP